MQLTKFVELTQGTIFTPADVERFERFIQNATRDTTAELFNRRLKVATALIKQDYRRGELTRARAIDRMLHLLENAGRRNGYCYMILKTELKKERMKWTAK